ncbi:OmpA family protein [Kordia sp.]|uniref:OmpA family protein n=1 Tax=Kordia sp. TaxID=1965332 RepID=UPI003D6A48CF
MKKILFIIFICFISCKTNQNVISERITPEIIMDDFGSFVEHTKKLIFKSGTNELIENYDEVIKAISEVIKKNSDHFSFIISGHTDSVGAKDLNLALSQKRAEKIKELLVAQGCKQSRLTAKGYGELQPIASNKTRDGRKMNRRIEIVAIKI